MASSSIGNHAAYNKPLQNVNLTTKLFDAARAHLDELNSDYMNAIELSAGMFASPRAELFYAERMRDDLLKLRDGPRMLEVLDTQVPRRELTYLTTRTRAPHEPNDEPQAPNFFSEDQYSKTHETFREGIQTVVMSPHDFGLQFKDQTAGTSPQTLHAHELRHAYDTRLVSVELSEYARKQAYDALLIPVDNELDKNQQEINAVNVETEMANRLGDGTRPHYRHPSVPYVTCGYHTTDAKYPSDFWHLQRYRESVFEANKESAKIAEIQEKMACVSRRITVKTNALSRAILRLRYKRLFTQALSLHAINQTARDEAWFKLEQAIQPIAPIRR